MYCTKCGTNNEDNNAFCKNCGAKLVANNTESQSVAGNSGVANAHNSMKIKMIAGVAVVVIVIACSLMFIGTKIGEEDSISVDRSGNEPAYEIPDKDMYAISHREDTDDVPITENYLNSDKNTTSDSAFEAATDLQLSDEVSTLEGAKLLKEQTRARNKEALMEIIQNEDVTEEAKKDAVTSMIMLTETAQKESDAQMLLEAKGFTQTVVSITGNSVDVMVETENLTEAQTAEIIDIVHRKTDIASENIIITVLSAE